MYGRTRTCLELGGILVRLALGARLATWAKAGRVIAQRQRV